MSDPLTNAGFKVAGAAFEHAFKMLADLPKGDSLVGYAQAGVIEPSCIIDDALTNSDILPDVLQLAQSVYAGYFMRAFSYHNISIGNTNIQARLDKFATRRSIGSAAAGSLSSIARIAMEEYDECLVVDGEVRELPDDIKALEDEIRADMEAVAKMATGVEARNDDKAKDGPAPAHIKDMTGAAKSGLNAASGTSSVAFSKAIDIGEPVNLGSGRMINVTIKENDREVQVPVLIRMNAVYMATGPLVHILGSGGDDVSFGTRFKKWRLGGIDFWRDFVFCQDQVDTHKKNLNADKTGIYLETMRRRSQNSVAAAVSGSLSANNSSNIHVISSEAAREVELKAYGKLTDFNTRQKLFQGGYGMLLFVVDKQWNTVRMYTRDIPEYTELKERDLKAMNKNGGVDIGDVLTAFRTGNSPRLG